MKKKVLVVGSLITLGLLTACGGTSSTDNNTTEIATQSDADYATDASESTSVNENTTEEMSDDLDLTKVERVDITDKDGVIIYTLSDEELNKFNKLKSTVVDMGGDISESDIVYSFTCYDNDEATYVFHRHANDMLSLGGTYVESDDIDTFLYQMTEHAVKTDSLHSLNSEPTEPSKY